MVRQNGLLVLFFGEAHSRVPKPAQEVYRPPEEVEYICVYEKQVCLPVSSWFPGRFQPSQTRVGLPVSRQQLLPWTAPQSGALISWGTFLSVHSKYFAVF